jgi:D-aminopeptidase
VFIVPDMEGMGSSVDIHEVIAGNEGEQYKPLTSPDYWDHFTGAHASGSRPGVLAHNFAFDAFTVNGKSLNEVGINALIAGELGVAVSLVSGDDAEIAETREILGPGFIGIVTKYAVGRMAAITFSPARVRRLLTDSAAVAVARARRGVYKPFQLERPYRVEFTLRASYPPRVEQGVDSLSWPGLEKTSARSYRLVTESARQMGYLLDAIESVVLR